MTRIKKLALSTILALFIFGGVATTQSNTINANAKRIHAVKHHKKIKKHKKSAWKKGVPSELRGHYYAKQVGGKLPSALDMQKHTFITWYSGTPLEFSYNVRYKKIGHNQFTFLYNIHKIKGSMLLGEKNAKLTFVKINNKKIKVKGDHQIYHKVKTDYIGFSSYHNYLKGIENR